MKKTIVVLCLLAMVACDKAPSVNNKVKESTHELSLIAETPEGVKIYRLSSNGDYPIKIAVTKDGNQVAIAQH